MRNSSCPFAKRFIRKSSVSVFYICAVEPGWFLRWCSYLRVLRDHELGGGGGGGGYELFPEVMYVDRFVMYSATIPALWWGLFRLRIMEGKKLACIRTTLMPIDIPTLYIEGQKLYTSPRLLVKNVSAWCLHKPALLAVLNLMTYGCRKYCQGNHCSCVTDMGFWSIRQIPNWFNDV